MIDAKIKDKILLTLYNYIDEENINVKVVMAAYQISDPTDKRLRGLSDIDQDFLLMRSRITGDDFSVALDQILSDKYLSKYERKSAPDYEEFSTYISFTPAGRIFFTKLGGYTKLNDELLEQQKIQFNDRLWNRANILIALAALILSYWSFRSSENSKSIASEQQTAIDSLNSRVRSLYKQLRLKIAGTPISTPPPATIIEKQPKLPKTR